MSEATPRRGKKKHRKPEPEADPEFQIAPMIDILLVLLVFFMSISTTQVLQTNRNIRLAVAKDAKEAKDNPGQIIVNLAYNPLSNETGISVKEKDFGSPGEIIPILAENIRLNPMVRVLIRADRDVRYTVMKGVLEAVGKAGIANVTFSVVDKEASPSAPPPS